VKVLGKADISGYFYSKLMSKKGSVSLCVVMPIQREFGLQLRPRETGIANPKEALHLAGGTKLFKTSVLKYSLNIALTGNT
jgi:hypothetical protein